MSAATVSIPSGGGYFRNAGEADEFLDFESNPEECERVSYAENDRFEEWRQWRKAWIAGVA